MKKLARHPGGFLNAPGVGVNPSLGLLFPHSAEEDI
jgi:hypothetical protein